MRRLLPLPSAPCLSQGGGLCVVCGRPWRSVRFRQLCCVCCRGVELCNCRGGVCVTGRAARCAEKKIVTAVARVLRIARRAAYFRCRRKQVAVCPGWCGRYVVPIFFVSSRSKLVVFYCQVLKNDVHMYDQSYSVRLSSRVGVACQANGCCFCLYYRCTATWSLLYRKSVVACC